MATGIELPTKAVNGRLKLLSGDAYIGQLIKTMLGDGDSENPFQDIGLGESMIFDFNDATSEGEIRKLIEFGFQTLERDKLAKLETLSFSSEGAKKFVLIKYANLETGERPELDVPLPEGGL